MSINRNEVLTKGIKALEGMIDVVNVAPALDIAQLNPEETVLSIVDMVKGFTTEGILSSPRAKELIDPIKRLLEKSKSRGFTVVAFLDSHTKESMELKFRPEHCLQGTEESELVDEMKNLGIDLVFPKNSTNGFITDEYLNWIKTSGSKFKNFIIVGVCSDICISQYALTKKSYFNERDMNSRVIVPMNYTDTYDLGVHNADLMNLFSFYQLIDNGIEVVKTIE
ncbi:cysteine hydrolase family protein [Alkaliphilus sp. B6464]|uniref:cysteine hydrolase family protein n=1 Tax=Alkaliphilus sp. B6464 TaxID=2731219 RepID=UPI001BAD38E2|nr:isochorismatase family protein [Alkaliphilus sp. B6464]QUH21935.1 cysteine hydrolase [Alkaliphilus sp. B6464]